VKRRFKFSDLLIENWSLKICHWLLSPNRRLAAVFRRLWPSQWSFPSFSGQRSSHTLSLTDSRLIPNDFRGIVSTMSYKTVEVELENGRVQAAGAETLPGKARGLLTILSPQTVKSNAPV
jgi:hypothetical protein